VSPHSSLSRLWRPGSFVPALAGLLLLLVILPAQAIVIRHDRGDAAYLVDPARYPQLFHLHTRSSQHKVCMATLIASRWAITAAHCTEQTPIAETLALGEDYTLEVAGDDYRIATLVLHPDYNGGEWLTGVDLALIQLDRDVPGVAPALLNRDLDENGRIVQLFGWGHTGTGSSGRQRNDRKFRRAENLINSAGQWLSFRFDDPDEQGSAALPLEGVPGLGDSGGPALLQNAGALVLLGVALGELENAAGRQVQGRYGAVEIYERIALHLPWIEAVLGAELPGAATLSDLQP
jgi:hypothetical protein